MFLSYGLLREVRLAHALVSASRQLTPPHNSQLYELMLPVIFAVNLFGERLAWTRARRVRYQARESLREASDSRAPWTSPSQALLHCWHPGRGNDLFALLACGALLLPS